MGFLAFRCRLDFAEDLDEMWIFFFEVWTPLDPFHPPRLPPDPLELLIRVETAALTGRR